MEQNPLRCPQCGTYRFIRHRLIRFGKEPRAYTMRMPVYECDACDIKYESIVPFDGQRLIHFRDYILDGITEDGPTVEIPFKYLFAEVDVSAKFGRFNDLGFDYDPLDYYFIPGLYRDFDTGYLTPAFFDREVLLHYNNHPDYSVKLTSFSSGNIYQKGERMFSWGFGINRSGLLFMWLGDLDKDFDEENERDRKRFLASNVASDHDIVSKFYFSQIPFTVQDAFQESDNESKVFSLKNQFDERIKKDFGFDIAKIDIERLAEYYRPPILEDREQILNAYLSLTKYLIESLQVEDLKRLLIERGVSPKDLKGLGSLKVFERFISAVLQLSDERSIMTPLYVLYDLRVLQGHLAIDSFDGNYESCKKRLNAESTTTDLEFFRIVIKSLISMYETLLTYPNP
ncbi:hypothetical protein GGR92_005300 [Spirosoma lacussanchae]|uniref:hypothetical protein n=1 Tax=Spirosoma lacussanchae TaxID=1884249 RepID=UPI003D2520B5